MSDRWKDRTIKDSLKNAERIREEYPCYIQPDASDKDMILMADKIKELEARVNHFKQCYFNAQRLVIRELVSESEQDEAMSNLLDELK